jgi:hypothetical protein
MDKLQQVNGAIINEDEDEYKAYLLQRQRLQAGKGELVELRDRILRSEEIIADMRQDIKEMKEFLKSREYD